MKTALDALAKVCQDVREGRPEEGVLGVLPSLVAAPATVAEASDVMRVAAERDLSVVPRGGETRLDWGHPPARCDLLVDTARLDRVIEHAAGDLVVKAEAGLTMEQLAEVLAEQGQQLALDVPLEGSTVGGTLAAAAGGPRRLLYGSARDLLIGITIVRADGMVAKAGGKVVKNVAGYDLGKLLTGSYGTLGLIVEAAFRLHPLPPAKAYVTATFPSIGDAHQVTQRVLHSPFVPGAIELNAPNNAGPGVVVGVLVEGVPQGAEARAGHVADLLGDEARVSDTPPDWWGLYPDGSTLIEVSAPPMALPHIVAGLPQEAEVRGSAGLGSFHVGLAVGTPPGRVAEVVTELRRHASAVVRYAPEAVREEIDLWGPVPALNLMRRVKDQFDPDHRLSPGRFLGGI